MWSRKGVEQGGTLVVDGRSGLLDDVLGIQSPAGLGALKSPTAKKTVAMSGSMRTL